MGVPLVVVAVFLALLTAAAGVEVWRGRPFVARASAPVLFGRLMLAGGLTAYPVGQLVTEPEAASTAVKVVGTGLLVAGVAQLGAHWVREGCRSAADARASAACEVPAAASSTT